MKHFHLITTLHKKLNQKLNPNSIKSSLIVTGLVFFLVLVFLTGTIPWYSIRTDSDTETSAACYQPAIAEQVVRFHVLANSDSDEDQSLKLKVKQKIVLYLQEILAPAEYKQEAVAIIKNHYSEIRTIAEQELLQNNCNDTVTVCFEHTTFPEKTYGDLTFPAGDYDALRVLIGNGAGHNWWCVLYPSLCYVNETACVVPEDSKTKLRNSLSEKEYESLIKDKNTNVEYGSLLFDWIRGWFE